MLEVTTHHQPSPQKHNTNKRKKNQLVREAGRGLPERGRYGLVRRPKQRHVPQICSCEVFWRVLDWPEGPRYYASWAHVVPSLHPRSEREKDKKNNNNNNNKGRWKRSRKTKREHLKNKTKPGHRFAVAHSKAKRHFFSSEGQTRWPLRYFSSWTFYVFWETGFEKPKEKPGFFLVFCKQMKRMERFGGIGSSAMRSEVIVWSREGCPPSKKGGGIKLKR